MTKKNGHSRGVQHYKCYACNRYFIAGKLSASDLWTAYTSGKQTYAQLASQYGCSTRTIQRKIDKVSILKTTDFPSVVNVLMDTTYFGRTFGVMVFMNSFTGQILYKQYVKNETNALYLQGISEIVRRGITVQSIICDGRKGIFALFPDIPCQLCQFHQIQTITRYLTRKPKLEAGKELRSLVLKLTKIKKETFIYQLQIWKDKWDNFLKERSISTTTGKSFYTHKRLRSAYFSLKRNMPYLFVFEDYIELGIPNTTNMLDGSFSDLKNKLRNHTSTGSLTTCRSMSFLRHKRNPKKSKRIA
jgi:hypothetical protein